MPFAGTSVRAADTPSTTQSTQVPTVEEVVISGTRIVRDGYQAPTPVTVLGAAELSAMQLPNISDAVNRLPSFSGSTTTTNDPAADITEGVNNLNLRGLGPDRTLVLLDGHRVVGSTIEGFNHNGGAVDINVMPNNLISRVDVVTGGASAIYGSDALAGVVNFVLDKDFTGVKGSINAGITTYGDDENYDVSLAAGIPFAGGRGHILLSGENAYTAGIPHNNRPWSDISYSLVGNPAYTATNGQPQYITAQYTALAIATRGGMVLGGPLNGTQFGAGGTPSRFNFGTITGIQMIGGDWQQSRIDNDPSMDLRLRRSNAFVHASFDIFDNTSVFTEFQWADTQGRAQDGVPQFGLGTITVLAGNPFIPASVAAQMKTLGVTSLTLGSDNADLPPFAAANKRTFRRAVVGGDGKFDAFQTDWKWNAYYEISTEHISARIPGDQNLINYNQAVDAVLDPATGQVVCRSTLTNPHDGCQPFNPMGIGVNSPAAVAYVTGKAYSMTVLEQDVVAASVTGEPFSVWAGPVSIATGVEHRLEKVSGFSDALDEEAAYFAGNFTATHGSYNVTEGYVETVIPLAKNTTWAKSLDVNAAARATDYSTSGYVTTWKVGATYTPFDDITLRLTRSRDIRAPNLGDLYNAGRSGTGAVTDPLTNITTQVISRVDGNPDLQPEKADETGVGVVLSPTFLPGFGASIDYYKIDISGAIDTLNEQQIVDGCARGTTQLCPFIHRTNGLIDTIAILPANLQSQNAEGIDFEASYRLPLSSIVDSWAGDVTFRGLATYVISLESIGLEGTVQGAGVNADDAGLGVAGLFAPHFRYTVSATYAADPVTATLTTRGIGPGKYNNALIACTSGCPASTAANPTINNNHIDGVTYFDFALSYKIMIADQSNIELFATVDNLLNTSPPPIAGGTDTGFFFGQSNGNLYDRIGRTFHAGVRFKL
jgi:outer membrane receptor protein involved in Fe transport